MKKILVSGATGFIGRNTLEYLHKAKFDIIGLYQNQTQITLDFPYVEWEQGDLLLPAVQERILKKHKPEYLLHLAWSVPPKDFWHSLANINWMSASISLFRQFCEQGGKHFIGAGSIAEYNWNYSELKEDETPYQPQTLYGQCKRSLYEILSQLKKQNYDSTHLRWAYIGYFFGIGEPGNKLISQLINKLKNKEKMNLSSRDIIRDYAQIKYLAQGLTQLVLSEQDVNINMSGNNQVSLESIVNFIADYYDVPRTLAQYGKYESVIREPKILKVNTERMNKILGFYIENSFFQDLKEIMEKQ